MQKLYKNFVSIWQLWQNFYGRKAFQRGNLNCHILGTEGRRKLKFGEVNLSIRQSFSRENRAKTFST